jgi:hypothetical protein
VAIAALVMNAFYLAMYRAFNFDEFQVLHTGPAMGTGLSLYADDVGRHFPLLNITAVLLFRITGFSAQLLPAGRLLSFSVLASTLFVVYRIGRYLGDRLTGLLALLLLLSTQQFIGKGIEIRHDAFSTLFLALAFHQLVLHLRNQARTHLILSGTCAGLALACTQKAIVWIAVLIFGYVWAAFRALGRRAAIRTTALLLVLLPVPLIISLAVLVAFFGENVEVIFRHTLGQHVGYLFPTIASRFIVPFPWPRSSLVAQLLSENGFLYLSGLVGGLFLLFTHVTRPNEKTLLSLWAIVGSLFYLTVKRPFYQNLLPTIPALALCSALLVREISLLHWFQGKRALIVVLAIAAAVSFPASSLLEESAQVYKGQSRTTPPMVFPASNKKQIDNVRICLSLLDPSESVLCFSGQQIFFRPIHPYLHGPCGAMIPQIRRTCLVDKMKAQQCRVVIFDYRTRQLPMSIQELLLRNYQFYGRGDVFTPGFVVKEGEQVNKDVWIGGEYVASTEGVIVDGRVVSADPVHLSPGAHVVRNPTRQSVVLRLRME